jgi:serine/threonine protein kinase/Ca2+-binding EF-hand superfamily protein
MDGNKKMRLLSDTEDIFANALGEARAENHTAENFHRDYALGRYGMTGTVSDVKAAASLLAGGSGQLLLPHVEMLGADWIERLERQASGEAVTDASEEYERVLADVQASPARLKQAKAREESLLARARVQAAEEARAEVAHALEHEHARALAESDEVDDGPAAEVEARNAAAEEEATALSEESADSAAKDAAATRVQANIRGRQARSQLRGDPIEQEFAEQQSQSAVPPPLPGEEVAATIESAAVAEGAEPAILVDPAVAELLAGYPHLQPLDRLEELYDRSASWDLGAGANGQVSSAVVRATGELVAIKTMAVDDALDGPADQQEEEQDGGAEAEGEGEAAEAMARKRSERLVRSLRRRLDDVEMQRSLSHPHIAPVLDVFADGASGLLAFVMPLAHGGSVPRYLSRHRGHLGLGAIAVLVGKMLSAVAHCHEHGILHRDLKLDNFVFATEARDAPLQLIDFGMATRCGPGEKLNDDGMWATLVIMAPEMFYEWHAHVVKTGGDVTYGHKADVWAIGVIAYELIYGTLPFGLGEDPSEDFECTEDRIVREPLAFPAVESAEEQAAQVAALAELPKGSRAWYTGAEGVRSLVTITTVHYEEPPPYYTITLEDGTERSTVRTKLTPAGDGDGSEGGGAETEIDVAARQAAMARAFCERLLDRDDERRPTAAEAMADPWIAEAVAAAAEGGADAGGAVAANEAAAAPAVQRAAAVQALIDFQQASVLKRAAYYAAASEHAVTSDAATVKALRATFKDMDTAGSGHISKDELAKALEAHEGVAASIDVDALFQALDVSGTGHIEWRWFLAATLAGSEDGGGGAERKGKSRSSRGARSSGAPGVVDAFLLLDTDGDGRVSAADVARLLASSPDEAARAMANEESIARLLQSMGAAGHAEAGDGEAGDAPVIDVQSLTLEDFEALVLHGAAAATVTDAESGGGAELVRELRAAAANGQRERWRKLGNAFRAAAAFRE